jgi:hypothetical protein
LYEELSNTILVKLFFLALQMISSPKYLSLLVEMPPDVLADMGLSMASAATKEKLKKEKPVQAPRVYGVFVYLEGEEVTFVIGERYRRKLLPAFKGTLKERLAATKHHYNCVTYLYKIFPKFMCEKFQNIAATPGAVDKLIQRDTLPCYKEFLILCRDNASEEKKEAGRAKIKEAIDTIKKQLSEYFFIFSKGTLDRPLEAPGHLIHYLFYERYRCLMYVKCMMKEESDAAKREIN